MTFVARIHIFKRKVIPFFMAYAEDFRDRIQRTAEEKGGSEISLYGKSFAVISGHKGLSSLSSGEAVVRLKRGSVRLVGEDIRVEKASPFEIYLRGAFHAVEFLPDRAEGVPS